MCGFLFQKFSQVHPITRESKQPAPLLLQGWEQSLAGIHFSAPQAHYQEAFESDMYDFFPKKMFPPTSTDQMAAK